MMDRSTPQPLAATPRHFLDLADLDSAALTRILDAAEARKAGRAGLPKAQPDTDRPLAGHQLAAIFDKPSTRTRVSFEMAMRQLGGESLILDGASTQLGRGESIGDTARVLSRYVDVISYRARSHDALVGLADAASVPVINALTDRSHPCQIVADLLTLRQHKGDLAGKTLAWVGDGNNVATSVIEACALMGLRLRLGCPESRMPDPQTVSWARTQGADLTLTNDAAQAVRDADAVYADTWVSMGDDVADAEALFGDYRVDDALMAHAPDALFLHCLPAHRGEEVTDSVLDGAQSVVWDQAENRLHAQKAVLLYCLGTL